MNVGGVQLGSWELGVGIYVLGVLCGLLLTDAPAGDRLTMALLWPIGPIAFVSTVTILLISLPVAFPKVGIPLWLAAASFWWLVS